MTRAEAELAGAVLRAHGCKASTKPLRRGRGFAVVTSTSPDRAERLAHGLRYYTRDRDGRLARWF